MRIQTLSALVALPSVLALGGNARADWEVPPPYTMPGAPTTPRAGTVAAVADNTNQANVYGPAVTFARAAGASYAGIGTTVTGATTAVVGTTTPIVGTGRPYFGSSAWLRAGKASSSATVRASMPCASGSPRSQAVNSSLARMSPSLRTERTVARSL
mgnify:CR=1 FL=1